MKDKQQTSKISKKSFAWSILLLLISVSVVTVLLLSCNNNGDNGSLNTDPIDIDEVLTDIDREIDNEDVDASYNEASAVVITFSNGGVSINGGLGASAQGTDVTISAKGTYIISGSAEDGSVTVDVGNGNEARIVLDGLKLTNTDGPAIYVKSGKQITFTLADGSENVISDASGYELVDDDSTLDAAVFSKSDLVFNGEGALTVNGNNAHGIVSKDGLTVTGGKYSVNSTKVGICGKDFIKIAGADITVNAGSDALRSDNETDAGAGFIYIKDGTLELNSVNDGIQAFSIVNIEGGTLSITTSAASSSESAKGIKGGSSVIITGGNITIDAEDDALHSNGDILISGGDFAVSSADDGAHADNTLQISGGNIIIKSSYEGIEGTDIVVSGGYIEINSSDDGMNASGGNDSNTGMSGRPGMDAFGSSSGSITVSGGYIIIHNEGDGVDSNGSLEVSGGVILVDGPSRSGNGSFDYSSSAKITGGVVITLGVSDMAQNFSEATQGSVLVSSNGYFAAGTVMSLCDEDGNVILAFTSTKAFSGALFSAPEIEKGKTYTFYMNATVDGLDENGYAHNTTQSGGTSCGEVTVEDYVSGSGSGMGGAGGGRPGRPW